MHLVTQFDSNAKVEDFNRAKEASEMIDIRVYALVSGECSDNLHITIEFIHVRYSMAISDSLFFPIDCTEFFEEVWTEDKYVFHELRSTLCKLN